MINYVCIVIIVMYIVSFSLVENVGGKQKGTSSLDFDFQYENKL